MARRLAGALCALAAALGAGCAGPSAGGLAPAGRQEGPEAQGAVEVGGARLRVRALPGAEPDVEPVRAALRGAVPRATRFAPLRAPVAVVLHPGHGSLEEAAGRPGVGWLRAWARFSTVDLEAPSAWTPAATPAQLEELLAHELAHCAMYQAAGSEESWAWLELPLWFREGMASVAADQGRRRLPPAALAAFYEGPPGGPARHAGAPRAGGDPLSDPEPLYADRPELVYSAAHHAFSFLLRRYGEERVREILRGLGDGLPWPEAFRAATGIAPAAFEAEFRRYLAWRGFPGG